MTRQYSDNRTSRKSRPKTQEERKLKTTHKSSAKNAKSYKKAAKKKKESIFKSGIFRTEGEIDYTFLLMIVLLTSVGLIMMLSASAPAAAKRFSGSYHFFYRQFGAVLVGLVAMFFISKIDYQRYKKWIPLFMIICEIMLVMVLIPHIGIDHNGSRRWLPGPGTEIQPSEFMKLAIAMFFALLIEQEKYDISKIKGMLPFILWIGVTLVLMLMETHLSGAIVIAGIAVTVMVVGGAKIKPFVITGVIVAPIGVAAIKMFDPVRWSRIMSFMNPFSDLQGSGYQVAQGLYAIGSGGLFGRGLGQSIQKYSYLPEPYNDFIFAIVGEELGLIGSALIIGLFAALIMRGIRIAMNAPDKFSMLTATGIMAQIAIQVTLNIAVVTASVPNTGVSLPFFSYGGSAMIVLLCEMGILLNISRYSVKKDIPV